MAPLKSISNKMRILTALLFFVSIFQCVAEVPSPIAQDVNEHSGRSVALITSLPNGIHFVGNGSITEVTALRDDVLRVRVSHRSSLPEDASWSVLSSARKSSVSVKPEAAGFSTSALRVQVDPATSMISVSDLAGNLLQRDASPILWDGSRFRVNKVKTWNDHFFGLGDKPGPLDRSGQVFTMWNTDNFGWQESTDPIYKSIPFFIEMSNGRSLGVLLDNTFRSTFDFGREDADRYSFTAPDGPLDYYLLYGPEPKKVVEDYAWLTGLTPLPPMWSLGFQQSRYSYETRTRLEEVADRLRTDRIPTDALYMDIDYQVHNRPFTVDPLKYPNFPEMVQDLRHKQFHLVLITDLHIADLPSAGYAPFDSGTAGDHFVKNHDGTTYVGQVWPGASVFPDFTRSSTRDWWGTLYAQFVQDGVAGFWNDMNEPAVFEVPTKTMPDDVQHRIAEPGFSPRTATHLEVHNVYGMENSRATYDGLLKLEPNVRPFVLTRASYAGGQRYAATWTGDNSSTWNHLRMTVPQIVNLGLSGFAMTGADVGGFAGSPSPDLLTKWIEVAAFQPIDRDHAAKGTRDHEPWVDGPEHEAIRRHYIEERYRLMPYLYTTAEETSRTGLPIMRPLFLDFPHATEDGHPFDLDSGSEFMFGPDLLVAPNPSPEEVAPYEIQLPPGVWYSYWSGERYDRQAPSAHLDLEQRDKLAQRKPLMVTPTLADLPVYVRGGSILPMAPLTQSTVEKPQGPLTLRVYVDSQTTPDTCHGELYLDDGVSFNYRDGAYLRRNFTCRQVGDGSLQIAFSKPEGSYAPWWSEIKLEIFGWQSTSKQISTEDGTKSKLIHTGSAWTAVVEDHRTATTYTLR
jgi:alpha-glucosidase